tara:strand:+ start:354 stop:479 length:126 start_codon:yes stop_codon:yes gene_type:complete
MNTILIEVEVDCPVDQVSTDDIENAVANGLYSFVSDEQEEE